MNLVQARRLVGLVLALTPLIIAILGGPAVRIGPSYILFTLAIILGASTGVVLVVRGGHLGLLHRALSWFAGSALGIIAGSVAARLIWSGAATLPWYSVRLLGVLYALIAALGVMLIPARRTAIPPSPGMAGSRAILP
jgi:hypothetical protein